MLVPAGLYRVAGYSATHEITISGARFVIPVPYKAGHVCTEGEASNPTDPGREDTE